MKQPIYSEDGWYTLRLFGKEAYADIGLCLVGKPPSQRISPRKVDAQRLEKTIAKRSPPMTVKPEQSEDYPPTVYFQEIPNAIDRRYYEHVLKEYPTATFHLPLKGKLTNPITIKSEGEIVGAIMCLTN